MSTNEKETVVVRGPSLARRVAVPVAVVLSAGILVGGVVAGQMDWSESAAELDAALLDAPSVQLAEIPAVDGKPGGGVFGQVTSTGHFCLWDAPSASSRNRGGGCNLAEDPLGGRPLSVSLAYDGGPSVSSVTDARLIGLAAPHVAGVQVVMTDGSLRRVSLKKATLEGGEYLAFGYRIRKSDLRKGLGPLAVVAVDSRGSEIHRETTGFAG